MGVGFDKAQEALASFDGIGRRFEIKETVGDIMVVDDYGHHPAEIKVTLESAREAYNRRLVVAFQPHRYSRTRDLMEDFAQSFNASNILLVSDIYAAGEEPIDDIDAQKLVSEIRAYGHGDVRYTGSVDNTIEALADIVEPGDLVLTLGAGSVWRISDALVNKLQARSASSSSSGEEKPE